MQEKTIVGVDVSKATLDYMWLPGGRSRQEANTHKGIATLVKNIAGLHPTMVVLEATGGYQNSIVQALHEAAIPVKVVNPRQVRDFARSLNRLGKTDALDAKTLAEFGMSRDLKPDVPKNAVLVRISYLLLRRNQLHGMITAEKGHLEHTPEPFAAHVQELITLLSGHLKALDKEIRNEIRSQPSLAAQDAIMQSIPGVGPVVAATVLAELPEITAIGRKEVAALVGVAPFNRDSGKYRGQRHICAGRAKVRNVFYCALRPCLQWNPLVKKWFDHFITSGKPYKVAVIACVRKLLIVIRAMLINNTTWKPKSIQQT